MQAQVIQSAATHGHACIQRYARMDMHASMDVYAFTFECAPMDMQPWIQISICPWPCMHPWTCAQMCIHRCAPILACIHMCPWTCTHPWICACGHAHTVGCALIDVYAPLEVYSWTCTHRHAVDILLGGSLDHESHSGVSCF